MPVADEEGAAETVVSQIEAADGGEGQGHRLAVVYDDATDTIKLYLDGYTNAAATAAFPNGLHSFGRCRWAGGTRRTAGASTCTATSTRYRRTRER